MKKRLTCAQVAELYGVKVVTVYDWIRKKKLAAVCLGKQYVIRPEDLSDFEENGMTVRRRGRGDGDGAGI